MAVQHAHRIVPVAVITISVLGAPLCLAQVAVELRARAKQGDAEAQNELGSRYYEGRGVPQNDAEAVRWICLAAEQGYVVGQYNLGLMYFRGRGVSEDEAEAVTWYRRAAEQGYAPAQAALGYMYEYGAGVTPDQVLAYMWFHLAAVRSPDEFWTRLYSQKRDEIAEMMTPDQLADARRLAAEWKPLAER